MSDELGLPKMKCLAREERWAIKRVFASVVVHKEVEPLKDYYEDKKGWYYKDLIEPTFRIFVTPYASRLELDPSKIKWQIEPGGGRVKLIHPGKTGEDKTIGELNEDDFRAMLEMAFIGLGFVQDFDEYDSPLLRDHIFNAISRWPELERLLRTAGKGDDHFERLSFLFIGAVCERI